ncbi:MAG: cytochrome c [Betaproteobacteria bacterium]|nr:cytochrome c [Betaproteobacteria bacterium]
MNPSSIFLFALALAGLTQAQNAPVANVESARKMVEGPCTECHGQVVKGDATAIFTRADRRARDHESLVKQVHACGTQLKTPLFPEEEEHLATYLNQRFYQFKQ